MQRELDRQRAGCSVILPWRVVAAHWLAAVRGVEEELDVVVERGVCEVGEFGASEGDAAEAGGGRVDAQDGQVAAAQFVAHALDAAGGMVRGHGFLGLNG